MVVRRGQGYIEALRRCIYKCVRCGENEGFCRVNTEGTISTI